MSQMIKKVKEYYKQVLQDRQVIARWKSLGLWDEMPDELALKLEWLATYLLSRVFVIGSRIDTLMFPIVIRTFRTYGHLINNIPEAVRYVENNLHLLAELEAKAYMHIDAEAEFCDVMSSQIATLKL